MNPDDQWDIVTGIGLTALGVAASRAVESTRPDRLIDDPFAATFLAAIESPIPAAPRWPDDFSTVSDQLAILVRGANYTGVRTRFFDDYLCTATGGAVRQAVILAAGLDARAFRLDWSPGLRLFEIDQPKVLDFKDAVLHEQAAEPRCARQVVPIDLRADWPTALCAAGFDPHAPTAWLAEGLLQYLTPDTEADLFRDIHALSAPGSQLSAERAADLSGMLDRGGLASVRDAASGFDIAEHMRAETRPSPAIWLADRGWLVTEEPVTVAAERYHRDLHDPRLDRLPGTALHIADYTTFLSATRSA